MSGPAPQEIVFEHNTIIRTPPYREGLESKLVDAEIIHGKYIIRGARLNRGDEMLWDFLTVHEKSLVELVEQAQREIIIELAELLLENNALDIFSVLVADGAGHMDAIKAALTLASNNI